MVYSCFSMFHYISLSTFNPESSVPKAHDLQKKTLILEVVNTSQTALKMSTILSFTQSTLSIITAMPSPTSVSLLFICSPLNLPRV